MINFCGVTCRVVVVPDPTDARLLALVADVGRVAVHDLARRAGMDVREVAARLAGLAASGLPLVVGVECDPTALRHALSGHGWHPGHQPPGPPSDPMHGWPPHQPPVPGYPPWHGPDGVAGRARPLYGGPPGPSGTDHRGTARGAVPRPSPAQGPGLDPVGTWGPPGSAAWARGDELVTATVRTTPARAAADAKRTGAIGDTLHTPPTLPTVPITDAAGQRLAIRLVEVVDPADFLFTAAGYRLQPGERSVVVHTEVTNHGTTPLSALLDLYLVLLDESGNAISKAPVALSSRPPHRVGVKPGETAGGHTVYVLPEATELVAVRWSANPDDEQHCLTWRVRPP